MKLDRIALLRDKRNWSQEYFAELMDCSQSTVTSWENGRRNPSIDTICKIAELFDVSADYLLGLTDIPNVYNNSAGTGEAARAEDPQAMPSDVRELKELIIQIVDQVLDARLPASGGR